MSDTKTKTIDPQTLIDHAGAFYEWFATVEINEDGNLHIVADENPNDDSDAPEVVITAERLHEVVAATHAANCFPEYAQNFFADLLDGSDDADGDMDAVDIILQRAIFGAAIYS